ncbi:hypothetical protein F5Y09DRAFT_41547 [Xylaria sp. FL1042]|nr:hypothetical protein F5Y09DRAFT_41547 [Xylaria sp. FL1042]
MRGQEDGPPRAQFHNNKNYGGDQIIGLKFSGGTHCSFGNRLVAAGIVGIFVGVAALLVLAVGLALCLVLGGMARCCRSAVLSTPESPDSLGAPGKTPLAPNKVLCAAGFRADYDSRSSACLRPAEVHCCLVGCEVE